MDDPDSPTSNKGEEPVITPGGPRPRRLVTGVQPGQVVHFTEQGGLVMAATDAANMNAPEEFVVTPGGYRHKSLVHQVDAGVAIDVKADTIRLMNLETKAIVHEVPVAPTAP